MMQQHGQSNGVDAADIVQPRMGAAMVAVNLLWCVPGDVGGSEEYLVRQLLGLGGQSSGFAPTLYVVRSFIEAHPTLAAELLLSTPGFAGRRGTPSWSTTVVARPRRSAPDPLS